MLEISCALFLNYREVSQDRLKVNSINMFWLEGCCLQERTITCQSLQKKYIYLEHLFGNSKSSRIFQINPNIPVILFSSIKNIPSSSSMDNNKCIPAMFTFSSLFLSHLTLILSKLIDFTNSAVLFF